MHVQINCKNEVRRTITIKRNRIGIGDSPLNSLPDSMGMLSRHDEIFVVAIQLEATRGNYQRSPVLGIIVSSIEIYG